MTDLVHRPAGQVAIQGPPGSRALGVRLRPALRLSIGERALSARGVSYPKKIDHFRASPGAENQYAPAARKFLAEYGEAPKQIGIRLPGEFGQALDVRYKAYAGGQAEDGGVLVAKGHTNYALNEFMGGPDMLTVWHRDGTVEEVFTQGVDALTRQPLDAVAQELGLELYTTLRFGIPSVLGYGSFAEITTKGKESTDCLWFKLRGWYGTFGARTSWVVRPTLFVRPSTARPVVTKDGVTKRMKTKIYVLDVVLSESEDSLVERLREHASLTQMVGDNPLSQGHAVLAAGATIEDVEEESAGRVQRPALAAAAQREPEVEEIEEVEIFGLEEESEAVAPVASEPPAAQAPPPAMKIEAPAPVRTLEQALTLTPAEQAQLPKAEQRKPPFGTYQKHSLRRILALGEQGEGYLAYALKESFPDDPEFVGDLRLFCKAHAPGIYLLWKENRS